MCKVAQARINYMIADIQAWLEELQAHAARLREIQQLRPEAGHGKRQRKSLTKVFR